MQQSYGTTWFGPAYQPSGLHKIASYDLDGTLIKTKSGKIFPIDLNDWKLIGTATEHLKAKATDGYTVVVITNQKKMTPEQISAKFAAIYLAIYQDKSQAILLISGHENNYYRKPHTGLWEVVLEQLSLRADQVHPDSFYCGDMRTDHLFAHNIGLNFIQMIGDNLVEFEEPESQMPSILGAAIEIRSVDFEMPVPTLVIMVGPPASGKSTLAKKLAEKFTDRAVIINRDSVVAEHARRAALPRHKRQSVAAIMKEMYADAIAAGQHIIDDNTNPTECGRKSIVDLAPGYQVKYIHLAFPLAWSLALNEYRCEQTKGAISVPQVALHQYYKRLETPTKDVTTLQKIIVDTVLEQSMLIKKVFV